ncbi:class I SAM-dependent methyltransferase [bacterium]|nr:class I SAM-dependent methyltransferase [bacterium]
MPADLRAWFGDVDIYLFDQFMKGRFTPDMRVLDAGCGPGRNLVYLMRAGFDCYGVDGSPGAIDEARLLAADLAPSLPPENFRNEPIEEMSFDSGTFDAVICNAVLHFSRDEEHFRKKLDQIDRVTKIGGIIFARLMSTIGIEHSLRHIDGLRYQLPNRSEAFLVDEECLLAETGRLNGQLIEPLKTVNVQNQRCMTTWVFRKGPMP